MEKEKKFTLDTKEGCKKCIALFVCLILLFSFVASMIKSSGGSINIDNVKFDARGAVQDADLYTPVGTSDKSCLPCVILSHGGGCTKEVMNGFAQEFARRGYVVLNVSSYGSGLSGQPMYDEDGSGVENMAVTSQGLWDAVNYVRTLTFVDQTKILIAGHSQGGYRCGFTALNDCTYYTLNDMMINFMYEQFGINFTEEEISEDAAVLADKYLDESQKLFYEDKYAENSEYWNTRVKGVVSIGNTAVGIVDALAPQSVLVAGHEVIRYLQTNICLLTGEWDHNYRGLASEAYAKDYFQGFDVTPRDTWVKVDGNESKGVILGGIEESSIINNEDLANAIDGRMTRIAVGVDRITHSAEFLSKIAVTDMIKYTQQLLDYNNGPITGVNNALDPENIIWLNREFCNALAMFSMLGLAVSLLALLLKKEDYAMAVYKPEPEKLVNFSKPHAIIFWALTVLVCVYCSWLCNNSMKMLANPLVVLLPSSKFFPLDKTSGFTYVYLCWTGIIFLVMLALNAVYSKKKYGNTGLEVLGIRMKFPAILKSLLLAVLVFLGCYASMVVIRYVFGQDYRLWMCVFTDMQLIHWAQGIRYLIFLIPAYFVAGAMINAVQLNGKNKAVSAVILTVVIGSLGVWINHFVHVIGLYSGSDAATFTVNLISEGSIAGGMLIFVPITIFIAKMSHKLTGSIWAGTFINSFLTAWLWVSAISSTNIYMGTGFIERFFGF